MAERKKKRRDKQTKRMKKTTSEDGVSFKLQIEFIYYFRLCVVHRALDVFRWFLLNRTSQYISRYLVLVCISDEPTWHVSHGCSNMSGPEKSFFFFDLDSFFFFLSVHPDSPRARRKNQLRKCWIKWKFNGMDDTRKINLLLSTLFSLCIQSFLWPSFLSKRFSLKNTTLTTTMKTHWFQLHHRIAGATKKIHQLDFHRVFFWPCPFYMRFWKLKFKCLRMIAKPFGQLLRCCRFFSTEFSSLIGISAGFLFLAQFVIQHCVHSMSWTNPGILYGQIRFNAITHIGGASFEQKT